MENKLTFRPFVLSTLILIVLGWGGLALLLNFSMPTLWPRWGFYALIVLGATGTCIPVSYWLNKTFSTDRPNLAGVIVRESVAAGVYFALLAWLSIGRVLNFPIAVWIAIGLLVIGYLVRVLETANRSENVSSRHTLR